MDVHSQDGLSLDGLSPDSLDVNDSGGLPDLPDPVDTEVEPEIDGPDAAEAEVEGPADAAPDDVELDAGEADIETEVPEDTTVDAGAPVGVTESTPCETNDDCQAGNPCSGWRCNDLEFNCDNMAGAPECCTDDSDCDDGSACTVDKCYPALGACFHSADGC